MSTLAHADPKIRPDGLGVVQETMLIPLWARARETRRRDALVRDELAETIAARISYDFARFERAWKTQIGVVVRTRSIDTAVRGFVARSPDAVVVNIGAGLDTRFQRVDNGRLTWFDLDTPDAIEFRQRCLPAGETRSRTIAASVFETDWIDHVRDQGGERTLFIAEGVLMFLPRDRVRALLERLAVAFPCGEMILDCIGTWMVHMPWLHDSLTETRAEFAWGLKSATELDRWSRRYTLVRVRSMLDEAPSRWRWMRWLRFLPGFSGQFVVAHLRFAGPDPA